MLVNKRIIIILITLLSFAISFCSDDNSSSGSLPKLTDADLKSEAPCPNQDLLTDESFLAKAKAATQFIMIFNIDDMCSRDTFSLENTQEVTLNVANSIDALSNTGIGICGDVGGWNNIPLAGVYRRDFKFTDSGTTYRFRIRITISAGSTDVLGDSMTEGFGGTTLSEVIKLYDADGVEITETGSSLISLLTENAPSTNYTIKRVSDGAEVMKIKAEVICAAEVVAED